MNTERTETVAERELANYRDQIRAMTSDEVDLLSVEEGIIVRLKAIGAEMMIETMRRADTDAAEVIIDGERFGSRRTSRGTYQTMFGEIVIERSVYQQGGRGRLRIPMDLRVGITEGAYTPKLTRVLTRGVAVMTEDDAAEFVNEVGLGAVSSSTFHRVSRAVAALYEAKRAVIEVAIREQDAIPDTAVTVQVGIDGVMVPQDGEHAMPRGRKTDSPDPPRHGVVGMGPAEHDGMMGRAWHEASVATLAFFNDQGTRLKTIYIARMPEPNKATTVATLEEEALAVLCDRPDLNIVFASDGAEAQWAALEDIKTRLPKDLTGHTMDLVDGFHVAEYVPEAAEAIDPSPLRAVCGRRKADPDHAGYDVDATGCGQQICDHLLRVSGSIRIVSANIEADLAAMIAPHLRRFGVARSKRRGACSRSVFTTGVLISPASCRMRRTSDSDTPSASNRAITSRIRRVPHSSCSRLSVTTPAAGRPGADEGDAGARSSGSPRCAPPGVPITPCAYAAEELVPPEEA